MLACMALDTVLWFKMNVSYVQWLLIIVFFQSCGIICPRLYFIRLKIFLSAVNHEDPSAKMFVSVRNMMLIKPKNKMRMLLFTWSEQKYNFQLLFYFVFET